jgi:CRISPR-associated protein Cmr1
MTAWTTVALSVTTPLFNGGPTRDADPSGVRVPSMRGPLRFWFRALAAGHSGPDPRELARRESEVFGDTDTACPVALRIPDPPRPPPELAAFTDPGLLYLLGPGLADVQARRATRRAVQPGRSFHLKLRLGGASERVAALTLAALWLTCAFGGIGARSRRGFGGLRLDGVEGRDLPEPWTPETLATPDADDLARLELPAGVRDLLGPPVPWTQPPPFPVLDPAHFVSGLSGSPTTWSTTLIRAGRELRLFRASVDAPHVAYRPRRKTPEWLHTVHGEQRAHFPLGALGLPIVFKNESKVKVWQAKELRRASPLWLRAVGPAGRTKLLSFAFLGEFLPTGPGAPSVRLGNRQLTVTDADIRRLAEQWITTLGHGGLTFDNVRRD